MILLDVFLRPLVSGSHFSVLVLPEVYRIMGCSGSSLQEWFPYATLLGSTVDTCLASVYEAFGRFSHFFPGLLWEMTPCMSPCSALSLVRQRIHALRQSTELFEEAQTILRESGLGSPYSSLCLVQQRIHALRQSTVAWVFHGVSP